MLRGGMEWENSYNILRERDGISSVNLNIFVFCSVQ